MARRQVDREPADPAGAHGREPRGDDPEVPPPERPPLRAAVRGRVFG
jgi:hypothetical protein